MKPRTKKILAFAVAGLSAAGQVWLCLHLTQYAKDRSFAIGYTKASESLHKVIGCVDYPIKPNAAYLDSKPVLAVILFPFSFIMAFKNALHSGEKTGISKSEATIGFSYYWAMSVLPQVTSFYYGFANVLDNESFNEGSAQYVHDKFSDTPAPIKNYNEEQLELNDVFSAVWPLVFSTVFYLSVWSWKKLSVAKASEEEASLLDGVQRARV